MATKATYLKRSKTGWFSYRRKVPERLRAYFPSTASGCEMQEWKASFRTKDPLTAQRLWVLENKQFDEAERVAEIVARGQLVNLSNNDALKAAKQIAMEAGFHPDQAPIMPKDPTDQDWQTYKREREEWQTWLSIQRDILRDQDADERLNQQQIAIDYQAGRWGQPGYETPYKPAKANSILAVATKILDGELQPSLVPSWGDAVDLYISVNKQEKTRSPTKEKKWETKTRGLLNRFAIGIGGNDTGLEHLDRSNIRLWLIETYHNQATRNRYINTLSAVINTWNRENSSKTVSNPFSGLGNKQREQKDAQKRMPFKPWQFKVFLEAIAQHADAEVRLIGLLMAWTGCRTSEAAGLTVRDVKLDAEVPHVVFRTNSIRQMEKGGLERAVPLVQPVLVALQSYEAPANRDAPFFTGHGNTRGFENVSAALRYLLNNKAGITDANLVPYSLRHTLKDRLAAAGVETSRAEYILGHVSAGSSQIHKNYGTMTPPKSLLELMNKTASIETWGYFED
jgi:integrase